MKQQDLKSGRLQAATTNSWLRLLFVALGATLFFALGQPASGAAPGGRYIIHVNDQLNVQVYGDQTLTQTITVLPGGDIFYPLVGKIHVAGQTPDGAAKTIAQALKRFVRNPLVSVAVVAQGQINLLVLGNVKTPGKFVLPATARVSDAIAAAGGLGPFNGEFPAARIADPAGSVNTVSLQKLLRDGDVTLDVPLRDGATVYVPVPATFLVDVFGSVDKPGEVQLNEGDDISIAVAKAGASGTANPDLNHILVRRALPNGQTVSTQINLYEMLQGSGAVPTFKMQKGDVVLVPQARKPMGNAIGNSVGAVLLMLRHLVGLP